MRTKLQTEESVMAIVIYHHEILYIKELIYGMPKFSLPKGHIEDGETKIECAIRECYEETGIILEPSSYVKSLDSYTIKFTNNKLEEVEKKVYPLLFKIMKKEVPKIKEPRILETNFISIEEFVNQCSYDNVKNIILSLMNDI